MLARDAIALLTGQMARRVRRCAGPDCPRWSEVFTW
jgi:predicted RNA-binding Zn ribbon-like protein